MATGSVSVRDADFKRVGFLYKFHAPFGSDVCVYCGEYATTRDHVAPISYVSAIYDVIDVAIHPIRNGLIVVPACKDCNTRAGSTIAHSVSEKRAIIHKRLRAKHARLLGEYDWTDEELAEMGHTLRTYIKSQENKRAWILQRLGWPRNHYRHA